MKSMLRTLFAIFAIAVLPLLLTAQEGDKPAPATQPAQADPATAFLEQAGKAVGGEWVDQAGIDSPKVGHGRFVSEWGINKKTVNSKTYWVKDGKPAQIYEGSTYWHPERKTGVFYSIGAEGQLHEGTVEEKDGVSISKFKLSSAKGVSDWEQHLKYLDADTMESTVYVVKDGKLVVAHSFKFHRKPIGWGLDKAEPAKNDAKPEK